MQPVRVSGLPASAPDTISHPTKKEPDAQGARLTTPSARRPRTLSYSRPSAPSKSGGWNYHLHCKRPQGSRPQLRPHPGPQAPRHPGPPPHPQRSRPQRSCQQRRPHPHCTSVILSMPAVAAAGSGRIGAAWVVPKPPAKTRPAIPAANSTRNICVHPIFPWLIRSSSRSLERREATDQLKNGTSCSMPSVVQGGTVIAHIALDLRSVGSFRGTPVGVRCAQWAVPRPRKVRKVPHFSHTRARGRVHIHPAPMVVCGNFFRQERPLLLRRSNNNEDSRSLGCGLDRRRIVPGRGRRSAERNSRFLHERGVSGLLASHARPAQRLSLPAR